MAHPIRARNQASEGPRLDLGEDRLSVLLSGTIECGGKQSSVRVRALSSTGARLEAIVIPEAGSMIHFMRGDVTVPARVVWSGATSFEVEFRDVVDVRILLNRAASYWAELDGDDTADDDFLADDEDEVSRLPIARH